MMLRLTLRCWRLTMLLSGLVLVFLCIGYAQIGNSAPLKPEPVTSAKVNRDASWIKHPWTGDNRPYQTIRGSIYNAFLKKQITSVVLNSYQAKYEKVPTALSFFRWAYASRLAAQSVPPIAQTHHPGAGLFDRVPNPNAYDYIRLEFLYNAPGTDGKLVPLAKRLLQKNSNDYSVLYVLVDMFDADKTWLTKQEALAYAQKIIALSPGKPESYTPIGGVYYASWLNSKSPVDGTNAVRYYRKYLSLASPNEPFRKQAELLISDIER